MQHTKAKETPQTKKRTRLSPKELRRLADRLVAAKDPVEVARLKKEMERGFYGDIAMLKAIQEGEQSRLMSRGKVFELLP